MGVKHMEKTGSKKRGQMKSRDFSLNKRRVCTDTSN